MSKPLLFTPLALRSLTLKNRVVVAPMHQYAGVEGFATDWHLMNAGRYAAGGAGLVMMESTKVERRGCGTVGDLGLWDDTFVPALARCADFVHSCGAAAGIQLGHSGRKSRIQRPWEGGKPLAKSDAIADWDAWELVAPSAIAFDAASGVPRALEVCEAVRASWPEDKPLFLRISAEDDAGFGPAQSVALANAVKPLGVDLIDCSSGGLTPKAPSLAPAYGYQVPYAEKIRKEAGIATMAVGLIVHAHQAEKIIAEGRADLVALAREMLYNPNWALDAARKLGAEQSFAVVPPAAGWWLARRAATAPQVQPSTFGND